MAEEEEEAKRDQPRILRSFATENKETKEWTVDEPRLARTEEARRSFPSRVKRIWSVIPDEIKIMNVKSKENKQQKQKHAKT